MKLLLEFINTERKKFQRVSSAITYHVLARTELAEVLPDPRLLRGKQDDIIQSPSSYFTPLYPVYNFIAGQIYHFYPKLPDLESNQD